MWWTYPLKSLTTSEVGGEVRGQIGQGFVFPEQRFQPVFTLDDLTGLADGPG